MRQYVPTWEISSTRLRVKYEGQEDKVKQNNTLSIDNDMFSKHITGCA